MSAQSKMQFALDLLSKLKTDGDNFFCSPVAIMGAFSILMMGAHGKSQSEIQTALQLHGCAPDSVMYKLLGELMCKMTTDLGAETECTMATRAFVQQGTHLEADFVSHLKQFFKGEVGQVDFHNGAKCSADINKWVEDHTNKKITNMTSPSTFTSEMRLALVNTIHFKASWYHRFNPDRTEPKQFHTSPGHHIDVPTMHMDAPHDVGIFPEEKCKMLSIQIDDGERFAMVIVLPDEVCGLKNWMKDHLTWTKIRDLREKLENNIVLLEIPKFKLDATLELDQGMKKLGLHSIFDPAAADLSGITKQEKLHVSKVTHKTSFAIDEEGIEATSATGMFSEVTCGYLNPTRFKINHPFLVLVVDKSTDAVLFIGQVMNPSL